jgi:outer membrane biosynthesis protein TonB
MVKSPPDFQTLGMTPLSDDDMFLDLPQEPLPPPPQEPQEPLPPPQEPQEDYVPEEIPAPEMVVSPHPNSPTTMMMEEEPNVHNIDIPIHLPDKGLTAWLGHMQRKQADRNRTNLVENLKSMFSLK